MAKLPLPTQFLLCLFTGLLLAFGVHLTILSDRALPLFEHLLLSSYVVNAVLAAGIFMVLYMLRQKLKNQLGFLFMGGSLLKFAVFFWLFYPNYIRDGKVNGLEFAAFFVPYSTALVLETYFATELLKIL